MTTTEVNASIRELIVQLSRSNPEQSESIVNDLSRFLKGVLKSQADPSTALMRRAQQTLFAIDEVRMMLAQGDYASAVVAARDARKEWSGDASFRPPVRGIDA